MKKTYHKATGLLLYLFPILFIAKILVTCETIQFSFCYLVPRTCCPPKFTNLVTGVTAGVNSFTMC